MATSPERLDERIFHRDENIPVEFVHFILSLSLMAHLTGSDLTVKYRDKESKSLAASATICFIVETLRSHSM